MSFLKMGLGPRHFVVSCYLRQEDRARGEEVKLDDGDKSSPPDTRN